MLKDCRNDGEDENKIKKELRDFNAEGITCTIEEMQTQSRDDAPLRISRFI